MAKAGLLVVSRRGQLQARVAKEDKKPSSALMCMQIGCALIKTNSGQLR